MSDLKKQTTHFGYEEVPITEKAKKVSEVFHSVADKYDIMNDVMSFGGHRLWKKFTLDLCNVRPGQQVLDVAAGTGDLSLAFAKKVGSHGLVVMTDINGSMLRNGRDRLLDEGVFKNVQFAEANAECLPFEDNSFDLVTIAFGLRNVTDKDKALRSMFRVLKPGGQLVILEFSKPTVPGLKTFYDAYSFSAIPFMGKIITGDKDSYQYLVESIRMHPDQATLKQMMENAGFEDCDVHNLTGGIVAVHRGYRYS